MLTLRDFIRVLILVLFEFAFSCRCGEPSEQLKKCYEVGYNTFCFFRPGPEYKWVTWQDAWQTCRRNNATLPAIPNEAAQTAFESYMKFLTLTDYGYDFWMAGQEVRGLEWKWLNGKTANLTAIQLKENMRDNYVHGVLTNDMLYRTDIPNNRNHFVCQLNGTACRSNGTIPFGRSCLLLNSTEAFNLSDARNRCVKQGGDLLVIDSPGDLDRLREIITPIPKVARRWIGLRRQWWTWKATDSAVEMQYSNWLPKNGFKPNRACMIAEIEGYKWRQESCSSSKSFVCQTVAETQSIFVPEPLSVLNPIAFIAFAVLGISIPVVLIIIAVIVKKKRNAREQQSDVMRVPSDRSYQDLQDRQENQYTGLHGITHQQSELSSDYQNISDYLNPGSTRVPSYVNMVP